MRLDWEAPSMGKKTGFTRVISNVRLTEVWHQIRQLQISSIPVLSLLVTLSAIYRMSENPKIDMISECYLE